MKQPTSGTEPIENAAAGKAKAVLVVVCIALFFQVLNASAVGVILPEIASGISADMSQIGWLMTGFLLVTGISIPFYLWASRRPLRGGPSFCDGSSSLRRWFVARWYSDELSVLAGGANHLGGWRGGGPWPGNGFS